MVTIQVTRACAHGGRYEINALLRRIYSDPVKSTQWAQGRRTDKTRIAKP